MSSLGGGPGGGRSSRLAVHGRRSGKDGYHVVAGGITRGESRPTERSQGTSSRRIFPRVRKSRGSNANALGVPRSVRIGREKKERERDGQV